MIIVKKKNIGGLIGTAVPAAQVQVGAGINWQRKGKM